MTIFSKPTPLRNSLLVYRDFKCQFPVTLRWKNLKTEVPLWKRIKYFGRPRYAEELQTHLGLVFEKKKNRAAKSLAYHEATVLKKNSVF